MEVVKKVLEQGIPPEGWETQIIRRADGSYEVSAPVPPGTWIPLGEGEEGTWLGF